MNSSGIYRFEIIMGQFDIYFAISKQIVTEINHQLMEDDINIMTSIKVIGDNTAANFLMKMGVDINQLERSGKIFAMAGLNPAVNQSGKTT